MRIFTATTVPVTGDIGGVAVTAMVDLDLATIGSARAELARLLEELPGRTVVLDVSGVFVDARGLRLMAYAALLVESTGGRCTVVSAPALARAAARVGFPLELRTPAHPVVDTPGVRV